MSRCGWRRPASGRTLDLTIRARCGRGPKRSLIRVTVGQTVLYSKYGGTEVTIDGKDLLILSSRDVLAVVES